MHNALARMWWVFLLSGLCSILFGVLAFAWPGITLVVLMVLYGAYCIADGVFAIAASGTRHESGRPWGRLLLAGIVSILAGIAAFAWPGLTALVLLYIIAVWAVIRGLVECAAAIEFRKVVRNEWMLALAGMLSILFGLVLLTKPAAGALTLLWAIGALAIARGVVLVVLSLRLRSLAKPGLAATGV